MASQKNNTSDGNSHRRNSSLEIDPFESPDLYYGPITDPLNKQSKFGRLRTRSVIAPKPQSHISPLILLDDSNKLNEHDGKASFYIHKDSNSKSDLNNSNDEIDDDSINYHQNINSLKQNDEFDFEALKKLKSLNLTSSGNNTPVISDSDSDSDSDSNSDSTSSCSISHSNLDNFSIKSHSKESLIEKGGKQNQTEKIVKFLV